MKNRSTRQALAEDIKREVLMDLNRFRAGGSGEQELVNSIKQEIMLELGQPPYNPHYSDRELIEAVKGEVLNQIRYEMRPNMEIAGNYNYPNYPDRATIESMKREIVAQIEADQEAQEESMAQKYYRGTSDPALIEAIKNSVLAEMRIHPV